jgi:bacterioferritin-associated ferredoxin
MKTVCLCSDVDTQQLSEAYDNGDNTFLKMKEKLGVATGCGTCEREVMDFIFEKMKSEREPY